MTFHWDEDIWARKKGNQMKDRRKGERRSWDGKNPEKGECRKTIIKAGRRSGIDRRSPNRMPDYKYRSLNWDFDQVKKIRGDDK